MTDYTDNMLASGVGYLSYIGAKKIAKKVRKPYSQLVLKSLTSWSPEENKILKQATYDAFKLSGLKEKHFHLHHVDSSNVEHLAELLDNKFEYIMEHNKFFKKIQDMSKSLKKKKVTSFIINENIKGVKGVGKSITVNPNLLKNISNSKLTGKISRLQNIKKKIARIIKSDKVDRKSMMKIVSEGRNAFCSPLTRDIMINTDRLAGTSFHEMGHALNATSKYLKYLSVSGHLLLKMGLPVIVATALLTPKKKEGEEPQGIIGKTTTFFKNNVGKLVFAAWLPTLAEEGLASIRGAQLAKKVLNPQLLKRVNQKNFFAFTTYVLSALIAAGCAKLAVKIRDKAAA